MKYLEVEMLSETVNCPVVHIPGRKFPGVVLQGDSLKLLLSLAEDIQELTVPLAYDELNAVVANLKLKLAGYVDEYEASMKAHGRGLPYAK